MANVLTRLVDRITGRKALLPPDQGGAWTTLYDSTPGGFQMNLSPLSQDGLLAYHAVFSCITLIANDISKLPFKLMQRPPGGIWQETESGAYSPVLRRPNAYQNPIQFRSSWQISRLTRGNTYALKERDNRGVVTRLHVLDPDKVEPLVSEDGEVFYRLRRDNMPGIEQDVIVPAREMIHDRMNCLFHPLVGISPLYACNLAATQGLAIQNSQSKFFANNATPSGILTAPGEIKTDQAATIRTRWHENYGGDNFGKVAVLGYDMKFTPIAVKALDAQLVEQLKLTAEIVCSVFHVPMWMIDLAPMPANSNEDRYIGYYSRALQEPIESMEACLDEGLGLDGRTIGIELDTHALMRMDTATRYKAWSDAIGGGWMAPNEARANEQLAPVTGGDTCYLQQQNYSLAALDERDKTSPLAAPPPAPPAPPADPTPDEPDEDEEVDRALARLYQKSPETLHVCA